MLGRKEARLNPVVTDMPDSSSSSITCFRCGERGHLARHCRNPPRKREFRTQKVAGKRGKTTGEQSPERLLYSVGCGSLENCDYVMLDLDVGSGEKLQLLVDSGADISLLKSRRLLGTAEFERRQGTSEECRRLRYRNTWEH